MHTAVPMLRQALDGQMSSLWLLSLQGRQMRPLQLLGVPRVGRSRAAHLQDETVLEDQVGQGGRDQEDEGQHDAPGDDDAPRLGQLQDLRYSEACDVVHREQGQQRLRAWRQVSLDCTGDQSCSAMVVAVASLREQPRRGRTMRAAGMLSAVILR